MSGQSTPAGWYPDPENASQERYWDGAAWGDSRALASAGFGAPAGAPAGYGFGAGGGGGGADATFGQRFLAALIDGLVIVVGYIAVLILTAIFGAISDALGVIVLILGYLAVFIGAIYYFATAEGSPEGQTIGKKQMKIRTVDAQTRQPGIGTGRAVGRYLAKTFLSGACVLGYLWMLWDPEKQTWHDKIATTKVVQA